jgi:ABC-type multidrug transport system fused ATPase/permease subunit
MKNEHFWKSARVLLRFRREIVLGLIGAGISAACFGAGLGMLLPVLKILLGDKQSLADVVHTYALNPARPQWLQDMGRSSLEWMPTDPFVGFLWVMGVIAALSIIGSVGRYLHELQTVTITLRAAQYWRARMFRRLIHAPMELVLKRSTSDHIGRMIFDVDQLRNGYSAIAGKTIAELLKGFAALVGALLVDWQLTLLAAVVGPVIFVLLRKFGKSIRRASKRALKTRGRMIASLKESLGGISVVKVHNAEGYERRRYAVQNRALLTEQMHVRKIQAMSSPVIDALALLGVITVASIAAYAIFRMDKEPANFVAVVAMLGAAGLSLKPLSKLNEQVSQASAAASRILDVVAMPTEPAPEETRKLPILARHKRNIELRDIRFFYPDSDRPAVDGVSLSATHGQTIAIVGGNGSGKSTLLSMLPRLFDPAQGQVLVDGVDIAGVRLRSLRAQCGVVTQQTVLFQGSIADNIAYGRRHVTREAIIEAAKRAHADEFIAELPQGYDTQLGEDGVGLSGGQKQRLSIARAILRNPAILILDEATSQIDADSEAKINDALRDLRHGRTTFVIAHRLSTVIDADQIIVMDHGKVVGRGTHRELLDTCPTYATLARTQLQPAD